MYYIETYADGGYHKYVASMTGAVVKGQKVDEGAYQFEKVADCDRAVQAINKVYGTGTVIRKTIGGELSTPKVSKTKAIPKKSETTKASSPKVRTSDAMQLGIIRNLVSRATPLPQNPWDAPKAKASNDIPLSAIVKATLNKNKVVKKNAEAKEVADEINIDDAENIGMDQYTLDENGGDF